MARRAPRIEVVAAAKVESFGQEIARAFERLLKSGDLVFTLVTKDLKLTEAQNRQDPHLRR